MNTFGGVNGPVVASVVVKKRTSSKNNYLPEDVKKMRHLGGGKMPAVACSHKRSSNYFCHADTLTPGDLQRNFESFYAHTTKTEQDQAILQLVTVKKVQRRRPKVDNTDRQKERDITNEYHLLAEDDPAKIPVCKPTFCSVLGELLFY